MKKFKVTETIPATVEYTYYVEAENEEQALDIVMNGDAEETATMRWVEEGDGEWEVEEETISSILLDMKERFEEE